MALGCIKAVLLRQDCLDVPWQATMHQRSRCAPRCPWAPTTRAPATPCTPRAHASVQSGRMRADRWQGGRRALLPACMRAHGMMLKSATCIAKFTAGGIARDLVLCLVGAHVSHCCGVQLAITGCGSALIVDSV